LYHRAFVRSDRSGSSEYDGLALSGALDQASNSGTSTATDGIDTGPVTASKGGELLFAFTGATGTTVGSNFMTRSTFGNNLVEDRLVPAAGSINATATMTAGSGWTILAATFKGR
jgi:hypothetical protein